MTSATSILYLIRLSSFFRPPQPSADLHFLRDVDLYVWPEAASWQCVKTCRNDGETHLSRDASDARIPGLELVARRLRAPIAVGAMRVENSAAREKTYNSLIHVVPGQGLQGVYDKWHLVPFLESMPDWAKRLGWSHRDGGFTPGAQAVPFTVRNATAGDTVSVAATICYDMYFPDVHRHYMNPRTGPRPDVFICGLNESLDGSGTVPRLSFMQTRLRAVECRRPYYRTSQDGHKGIVDSCGRVLMEVSARGEKMPTLLLGRVAMDQRSTVYAMYGDWLPILACSMAAGIIALRSGRSVLRCLHRPSKNASSGMAEPPKAE